MWQQWLNFVVGLWLIVSAFIGLDADSMATNLTVSGIVVAVLALWGALQHNSMMHRSDRMTHRHA